MTEHRPEPTKPESDGRKALESLLGITSDNASFRPETAPTRIRPEITVRTRAPRGRSGAANWEVRHTRSVFCFFGGVVSPCFTNPIKKPNDLIQREHGIGIGVLTGWVDHHVRVHPSKHTQTIRIPCSRPSRPCGPSSSGPILAAEPAGRTWLRQRRHFGGGDRNGIQLQIADLRFEGVDVRIERISIMLFEILRFRRRNGTDLCVFLFFFGGGGD